VSGLWKNTYFRRTVKTVLWITAILLVLVIGLALALQFPQVQNYIAQKAISPISEKTHTRIELGSVTISLPNSVVLKHLFIEDRARDTLLSVGEVKVDVNLFGLLSRTIRISNVRIDSLTAHVTRSLPDSAFNFDFLIQAVSSQPAGPTPPPDTSQQSAWTIGLYGLTLRSIHVSYLDDVSGMDARLHLGALDVSMDAFDLAKKQFHIGSVTLENTSASIIQSKEAQPDTSKSGTMDIGLGTVLLSNVHFRFENSVAHARYAADLGNGFLAANDIDLPARRIALKQVSIGKANIVVSLPPSPKDTSTVSDSAGFAWTFILDKMDFGATTLQYDVNGALKKSGLDPNHLLIRGLTLEAEKIYLSAARASAYLKHLSLMEHNGLRLQDLSFYAAADSLHAQLSDFVFETPSTTIHQDILLTYPSPSVVKNHPGDVRVNMSIDNSHIGIPDLLLFNPSLPVKRSDGTIGIEVSLSGRLNDLRIDECKASAGDSTVIDIVGTVSGLPDAKTAVYDLTIQKIASARKDIETFVLDTLLPKSIAIPASMHMTGAFKGTMNDFTASTDIWTTIGSIAASASFAGGAASDSSRWKTKISVINFDLAALMRDSTTFGPLSLTASADGKGMKKEDITAQVNVNVDKAVLLGYPYHGLSVNGTAGAEKFDGTIELQDSNLVFLYKGLVDISKDHPAYKFTFDLKGADLQRLKLSNDNLRVSAGLITDLTGKSVDDLNGRVDLRNVVILKNRKRFAVDSLMYVSVNKEKHTHISIESTIFGATFDGTVGLGGLPAALKHHFDRYFSVHDTAVSTPADSQSFSFTLDLRDPETLTDVLFPSLTRLDAGIIEGHYNSLKNDLDLNVGVNNITYNGISIDSLLFSVSSDARQLRTGLHVGSAADSQFIITNFDVKAIAEHDSIDVSAMSTDANGNTKLLLAGIISSIRDGYQFRFKPKGVAFQNTVWSVAPDNYIQMGSGRLIAHHVVLSDTGQSVAVQSTDEANNHSPLKIDFSKFQIANFSQIAERDSGYIGGTIDGTIELRNLDKAMAFTSDLSISKFAFGRTPVGDIALRANNQIADVYDLSLNLSGNGNRVSVQGQYKTRDSVGVPDLTVDFGALNLSSIEPFTFGAVSRLTGTMTGTLRVTGTTLKPSIAGTLKFAKTGFNPSALDTYLKLNSAEIGFSPQGIEFRSLNLIDSLGNTASIGGQLNTADYKSYNFDISVNANNFLLMNKAPDPKAMYYGTVFINSDIRLKGTPLHPVIDVQARLGKGTAVTFVLPEPESDVQQQRGIVTFVDIKNPGNPIMTRRPPVRTRADSLRRTYQKIDLTSNIEVTKDSKLRIIVDPISGDSLVVQGDATFSIGMDPSGKLSITGRYDLTQGSYLVAFNPLLRREFKIQKGSSLTWFGTPFDANVDITAVYSVKASPLDLVQDQISGMSREEQTKYKQDLPIQVYLQITGRLLTPQLSFRLDLPDDQRGAMGGTVYAKLVQVNEDESELNKQVFALLILGRFIPSDPLSIVNESGGGGLSGLARSSVSQLLTSQLNSLSQRYVKGVDLNVGIESGQDYSTGTAENRTQLQLGLSKSLFNERVTVQIGGNVDLEGPRTQQNSLNNFAGDIKVGYKLTEDGRWQMQVFRQTAYEGIIEGDLTETGVGLVFTIDYDRLVGFTLKPVTDAKEEVSK
jgi:translocation and assembly module TamB